MHYKSFLKSGEPTDAKNRAPLSKYGPKVRRSTIYFVTTDEAVAVKIGRTVDIANRMKALQLGCPVKLHLLGLMPGNHVDERALHERWASLRMHGEWYSLTAALRSFIALHAMSPVSDAETVKE